MFGQKRTSFSDSNVFLIDIPPFKGGMSTNQSLSYHENLYKYIILRCLFLFTDDSCFSTFVCQVTTIVSLRLKNILNSKGSDFKSQPF